MHYAKKSFLMVYVGKCNCYENIKIKLWSTISILKAWHVEIFRCKKENDCKVLQSFTMIENDCKSFCRMLHTCCYWGIPYITFSTEQISHVILLCPWFIS